MLNLLTLVRTIGHSTLRLGFVASILSTGFIPQVSHAAPFCKDVQAPFPNWKSSNPYEILGLATTASADEAQSAYRRLAMRCHRDYFDDPGLKNIILQRLNEAIRLIRANPNPTQSVPAYSCTVFLKWDRNCRISSS